MKKKRLKPCINPDTASRRFMKRYDIYKQMLNKPLLMILLKKVFGDNGPYVLTFKWNLS